MDEGSKTEAQMATARIKLLRNKREAQVRQMRRDIAALLESRQEDTARIRVEHVIREQNIMAANEIVELFCELIAVRLPIIAKQRECPADLKEGISSLIYAAPRCSEIPELGRIRDIFEKKYGKDFVAAASDLRPNSGVNRLLIEKLSVRKPTGEVKLKFLKEIAKQYQVDWDAAETEQELLKPPEERLDGPCTFVSATSIPMKSSPAAAPPPDVQPNYTSHRHYNENENSAVQFKDSASAAKAAAELAKKAVSAAQAAAFLANQNSPSYNHPVGFETSKNEFSTPSTIDGPPRQSLNRQNDLSMNEFKHNMKIFSSQSFNGSINAEDNAVDSDELGDRKVLRRNSCVAKTVHSDIKFDDSDGFDSESDEAVELERRRSMESRGPPNRPPPPPLVPTRTDHFEERENGNNNDLNKVSPISHVHPKLPDYDALTARFEALKSRKR
ncbi:IST1-like protein isoform X2 [Ananas comosus]|uniref:IST1-like protein isoform X2 n=1 Tax=Ananas comosus TaxID=4615 RepID=A0A6P5FBP1_ANACO|nr:IST1-like protein isoform X2 [Ananas comosus]